MKNVIAITSLFMSFTASANECWIDLFLDDSPALMKLEITANGKTFTKPTRPKTNTNRIEVPCGSKSSVKWYVRGQRDDQYSFRIFTSNGAGDVDVNKALPRSGNDYGSYEFTNN